MEVCYGQRKELKDLFLDTLKDIYFAEKKILAALPKMAKAANSETQGRVRKAQGETEGQVERLEQVFASIDETPKGRPATPSWASSTRARRSWTSTRAARARRGAAGGRPGGRALRNLPLRHAQDLGENSATRKP